MDAHEVAMLPLGLYRIHWKSSGTSLAAVGNNRAGLRWFAPVNWASIGGGDNQRHWDDVDRVEAIEPGAMESDDGESPADATPDISEEVDGLERKFSAILDAAQKSIRINISLLRNEVIGLRKRTEDLLKLHEKPANTLPAVSFGAPPDSVKLGGLSWEPEIYSPPGPHRFQMQSTPPVEKEEEDQHLHWTIEHVGTQANALVAGAQAAATITTHTTDGRDEQFEELLRDEVILGNISSSLTVDDIVEAHEAAIAQAVKDERERIIKKVDELPELGGVLAGTIERTTVLAILGIKHTQN